MMQEIKERGGLGLPCWENYYSATLLVWVKEWITLGNIRLLKIEGHDLQQGWHMALWQDNTPQSKWFTRHYIRNILIQNWEKISKKYYIKTPCWVSPLEALTYPKLYNPAKKINV